MYTIIFSLIKQIIGRSNQLIMVLRNFNKKLLLFFDHSKGVIFIPKLDFEFEPLNKWGSIYT